MTMLPALVLQSQLYVLLLFRIEDGYIQTIWWHHHIGGICILLGIGFPIYQHSPLSWMKWGLVVVLHLLIAQSPGLLS